MSEEPTTTEGKAGAVFDNKLGRYIGWVTVVIGLGIQIGMTTARLDALASQVQEVKVLAQSIQGEQADKQRLIGRFEAMEKRLDRIENLLDKWRAK